MDQTSQQVDVGTLLGAISSMLQQNEQVLTRLTAQATTASGWPRRSRPQHGPPVAREPTMLVSSLKLLPRL
jgi:hypothetical protein